MIEFHIIYFYYWKVYDERDMWIGESLSSLHWAFGRIRVSSPVVVQETLQ